MKMSLLTYIALPKKLPEYAHSDSTFRVINVLSRNPGFITHRCFENKFVYALDSRLDFCPYKMRRVEDINYDGRIITEEMRVNAIKGWEDLRLLSLRNRAKLEFLIRHNLVTGESLEIYSMWWSYSAPDELPPPEYTVTLHIDELEESRDFVLDDGYKFIIYC